MADSTVSTRFLTTIVSRLGDACNKLEGTREPLVNACNTLAKDRRFVVVGETMEGEALDGWAWDARGGGWANTVTAQRSEEFQSRLGRAETAYTSAWENDHTDGEAACGMIDVMMAGGGEHDQLMQWYHRAVAGNCSPAVAANMVMNALQPRWGGSTEELLDFGRDCVKAGDWDHGMPMALIHAHMLAAEAADPEEANRVVWRRYFADPSRFAEIQPVFEEYLRRHPSSLYRRCEYADIAVWSGKWDVAAAQYRTLNHKRCELWSNAADYEASRKEVANHLGKEAALEPIKPS